MEDILLALLQTGWLLVQYVFALLFMVVLLIGLHEYGHYKVARMCGVRVNTFAIGFGRELFGYTDRHGTRWSFKAIPAGGYVAIFGDVDPANPRLWDRHLKSVRRFTPEERAVAYFSKSVWQRMAIVLAGPMINLIPAVFVLALIFWTMGQESSPPVINAIDRGAAAYESGFRLGDEILTFEGKPIKRLEEVFDLTMEQPERIFSFTVKRGEEVLPLRMKPDDEVYTDTTGAPRKNGRTGMGFFRGDQFKRIVSVDGIPTEKDPDKARALLMERLDKVVLIGSRFREDRISEYEIIFPARYNTHLSDPDHKNYNKIYAVDPKFSYRVRLGYWDAWSRTVESILKLPREVYYYLRGSFLGKVDEPVLGGVARISDMTADSVNKGWYHYLIFLCIFSVQLAFINLLPIPALDGGHMLFLGYEAVRGKPVPETIQNYAMIGGVAFVIGIMILANVSDIFYFLR